MVISDLISILNAIRNECGDIAIELYIDKRQYENPYSGMKESAIITEDLKLVKVKEDGSGIYLSNEFRITDEYKGCKCDVLYDPEQKIYRGKLIPPEYIEGFNTTFVAQNKYDIRRTFEYAVDEYLDFLGNAKITMTHQVINNIKKDIELDYGEIEGFDESYLNEEDDGDYGEV
jgi:predicted HicB family RNase H-like nuclease